MFLIRIKVRLFQPRYIFASLLFLIRQHFLMHQPTISLEEEESQCKQYKLSQGFIGSEASIGI